MSTILVTGANGQLGNEMRNLSGNDRANRYFFTDVQELDITDPARVQAFLSENKCLCRGKSSQSLGGDRRENDTCLDRLCV